jgi:protein gp37
MASRLEAMGQEKYKGLTKKTKHGIDWTGKINFNLAALEKEVKRKKPTMFFVPSMSDLFHKDVPSKFIDKVFTIMGRHPQHIFQVLTKRDKRLFEYCDNYYPKKISSNIWLGVSIENQKATERISAFDAVPDINIKWLSIEPLLEAVTIDYYYLYRINWVVVGCESGIRKRECKIGWIESIVEQCKYANVPVFVKQINVNGKVIKDIEQFPKHLQIREYPDRRQSGRD